MCCNQEFELRLSFQPVHFDVIVAVNVTLLLVLSGLFISVMESMPRTSYIKMVDAWLLFCLLMPLLEVIFHAIVDKYRYDVELEEEALVATYSLDLDATQAPKEVVERKKQNIKWMQKMGAIGFPLIFALFVIAYFLIGQMKV